MPKPLWAPWRLEYVESADELDRCIFCEPEEELLVRRGEHALAARGIEALRSEYGPHGFNLGWNIGRVAGAGIEHHVHQHVVPRWNGDTSFMPVLGDVKVLPEHLLRTAERLRPHFA